MLNNSSHVPIYIQIANQLLEKIFHGDYVSREKLPSENDLAILFNVSRVTIRHALKELEKNQFIYSDKGKGSFVAPLPYKGFFGFDSFSSKCKRLGRIPSSKVIRFEEIPSVPIRFEKLYSSLLENQELGPFYVLERVRMMDSISAGIEESYLPKRIYPSLDRFDFSNQSLYSVIEKEYGIIPAKSDQFFSAMVANKSESELLNVELGHPFLVSEGLVQSEKNEVLELSKSIFCDLALPYHVRQEHYQL
jgi:GntR family transcriptional regulator